MSEAVVDPDTVTEQQSSQPEVDVQEGERKDLTKEPDFCLESIPQIMITPRMLEFQHGL